MPYVQRDASGQICAIFQHIQHDASELLPNDHPDILNFLGGIVPQNIESKTAHELSESDISLIRVIEDIVDTLIDKNVIRFTDLPEQAREKIMQRKSTRERLFGTTDLLGSEDEIF